MLLFCEILGFYLQQHRQDHVVKAQIKEDPQRHAQANKEQILSCQISRSKLTDSGVTDNTALPCSST